MKNRKTFSNYLNYTCEGKSFSTRCRVKILTDFYIFKRACEITSKSKLSDARAEKLLEKMYSAEHSPIRTRLFWIELHNVPTFVCNHFVRHKVGVEFFCQSHRADRSGVENSKSNRLTPTTFAMLANAQALINMARKRLCRKASLETRMIMGLIKNAVFYVDPKLSSCLNPDCLYRGGKCHELFSCGCYPKA